MANDQYSLSTERSDPKPVSILPGNIAENGNGDWNGMPVPQASSETGSQNLLARPPPALADGVGDRSCMCRDHRIFGLHRHWVAIHVPGDSCAFPCKKNSLLDDPRSVQASRDNFEIYKNTQQQLFYGRMSRRRPSANRKSPGSRSSKSCKAKMTTWWIGFPSGLASTSP